MGRFIVKKYKSFGLGSMIEIRYGIENGIENLWKEIINIADATKRKEKIDSLLKQMNDNAKNNGFFGKDDIVKINGVGNQFKIDDADIYYMFLIY